VSRVLSMTAIWWGAALLAAPEQATPSLHLSVTAGKSVLLDSPCNVRRVAVANSQTVEAVVASPREVLVNALAPGETTVTLWRDDGVRLSYEFSVRPSNSPLDAVERRLLEELPGQDITAAFENGTAFLHGTADDLISAERAAAIAATLGKTINLLRVKTPPAPLQILLKVRFANVDRTASSELGANLFHAGGNMTGTATTGQFLPPAVKADGTFTIGDALNIFLFRPDLHLGATIKALQSRGLLEMLAEPNVLAIDGKPASFVAGGEFPFPTLQGGGAGLGAVTIQFREFGVRISFLPVVTPRGTIRLQVTPEVSSLDFANGLVFQGFNIPALSTRRVQTEVELENGQSFVVAGLLDNRLTESLTKIPGLGNLPVLGRLFQSRTFTRNTSELLVLVTPELVRPIPTEVALPSLPMRQGDSIGQPPRTPGAAVSGAPRVIPPQKSVPVETLLNVPERGAAAAQPPAGGPIEFVPKPVTAPAPAERGSGARP